MYQYKLINTSNNGICDVCKRYCTNVYTQVEQKYHNYNSKDIYEGWSQYGCVNYSGHEKCLKSVRR